MNKRSSLSVLTEAFQLRIKFTEKVMCQRTVSQPRVHSPHTVGSPTSSPHFLSMYSLILRTLMSGWENKMHSPPLLQRSIVLITYVPVYIIQNSNLCNEVAFALSWARNKYIKTKVTLKNRVHIMPIDSKTTCSKCSNNKCRSNYVLSFTC